MLFFIQSHMLIFLFIEHMAMGASHNLLGGFGDISSADCHNISKSITNEKYRCMLYTLLVEFY